MVELLRTDVAKAVNDRRPGNLPPFEGEIMVPVERIDDPLFHIRDVKRSGGSVKCDYNDPARAATYLNGDGDKPYSLCFIRYDEYLGQFTTPDGDWSRGMSRPDFIVVTEDEADHFIIHEISTGKIGSKKSKGHRQLLSSVMFLCSIPAVKTYIGQFKHRTCYLSATGCVGVDSPENIAGGFMSIYENLPDPVPIQNKAIENRGFEAYETNTIHLSRK